MTLAERFIARYRLPYAVACVLVGFGLIGIVNVVVSRYAARGDLASAVLGALSPNNLLQYGLVTYAFYVPRYMRLKLEEGVDSLSAVFPDQKAGFRRNFADISLRKPQLVTWALFLIALLVAVNTAAILGTGPSPFQVDTGGPFSLIEFIATIYDLSAIALGTLALSSVIWAYWSISAGIHRLGGAPLDLRPYYEDAFLGLKPVGSLALSLATVYFGFVGLFGLVLAAPLSPPSGGDLVGVLGFLFGLVLLGLALFFAPLNRLHQRMVREKQIERAALAPRLKALFEDPDDPDSLSDVASTFRLDMMDRKIASVATWPFDIGILGRLSVIAVSVTAILISRILALVLGI